MTTGSERRLAAVMAADIAGYSRLMGADEEGTLGRLKTIRKAIVDPKIVEHRGRIVKTTGDGMLVEFASAVDAARCAVEIQRDTAAHNADVPQQSRIEFRIGVHVGDIIIDDNDIFGDGVNIAARLEGIAEPGGVCISDDAHRQIRGKVDFAYNDMGLQKLKNITEPMRAWNMRLGSDAISLLPLVSSSVPVPLALPDKPSIAVLAFQNMSGDAEQEYFADGIAEDIITALSKSRWLFVIARNSSFTYKGHAVDIKQIGRELGVRYVLEGSVRKAGNRVRITGQLVEAATGAHLWAERYDRALEDIFAVQDEITHSIIGALAPGILAAEIQRSQGKETAELGQWERLMRAHWHIRRFTREDSDEAIRLLDELLRRQPDNALALADLAFSLHFAALFGWTDAPAAARQRMSETARRAVASDEQDAAAHTSLAIHELFLGQHDNCDPAVAARNRTRPELKLRPRIPRYRLRVWRRMRPGDSECAGSHAAQPARLPDGRVVHCERLGAFERGEFRTGRGLRQASDRLQSGVSGRACHVCRSLGASWAHGRRARRSRRIHAPDARADHGG